MQYIMMNNEDGRTQKLLKTDTSDDETGFVWYDLSCVDNESKQPLDVPVSTKSSISSIQWMTMERNKSLFRNSSVAKVKLYGSLKSEKSFDTTVIWNADVTWGTENKPLIVRIKPSASEEKGNDIFKTRRFFTMQKLTHLTPLYLPCFMTICLENTTSQR
jgi:hypothetical protein